MIEVAMIITAIIIVLVLIVGFLGQRPASRRHWTTHRISHEEVNNLWHKHD